MVIPSKKPGERQRGRLVTGEQEWLRQTVRETWLAHVTEIQAEWLGSTQVV